MPPGFWVSFVPVQEREKTKGSQEGQPPLPLSPLSESGELMMAMGPVLESEFLQMVYVLFHFIKDKPTHRNKNTKRQTQTQNQKLCGNRLV